MRDACGPERNLPWRMHRLLLVAAALAAALLATATPTASRPETAQAISNELARALAVPHVPSRNSAALAVDLRSGQLVFARHVRLSLIPASNQKLATSYAALVVLGPTYRIATTVFGRGVQEGQVWRGDLILKGYGDPTLSAGDLAGLAARLRAQGIRRVTGAVLGDESFFDARRTGPGWKSWYYVNESPPLSALTVDRARYRGTYSHQPAVGAAQAFRDALRARGIAVRRASVGRADAGSLPLASTLSAPLAQLLRAVNRESDNFTAEILLKQLGAVHSGRGTTASGSVAVRQILEASGVPLRGVRIADGSGLSALNRMTAEALVAILRVSWSNPELAPRLFASLAVAGRNGTLEDRMLRTAAAGRVRAKTGTLSSSSALAGFVRRRFVFAVLQNGHPVSHYWARRAQDQFAAVLSQH